MNSPMGSMFTPHQAFEPLDNLNVYSALNEWPTQAGILDGQVTFGEEPFPFPVSDLPHVLDTQEQHDTESTNAMETEPSAPMGPPTKPRKRKAPTLRAEDWEPYKARIIELHITEGRSLPEVKQAIEEEFGFAAGYVNFFQRR